MCKILTENSSYELSHFRGGLPLDHQSKQKVNMKLPVMDFIKRLITHIPDSHFRMVRYYNWLSNRTIGIYLPKVYGWLDQLVEEISKARVSWRDLYIKTFGIDPLKCRHCKNLMVLHGSSFPMRSMNVFQQHKNIATNQCW